MITRLPLVLAILASAFWLSDIVAEQPPNVVFVFIDDMGYGDLSCTGNEDVRTKNIDQLAADGIRFTQWEDL